MTKPQSGAAVSDPLAKAGVVFVVSVLAAPPTTFLFMFLGDYPMAGGYSGMQPDFQASVERSLQYCCLGLPIAATVPLICYLACLRRCHLGRALLCMWFGTCVGGTVGSFMGGPLIAWFTALVGCVAGAGWAALRAAGDDLQPRHTDFVTFGSAP